VPTLNIKDPEVYRLARELADRRGTSMTAVVRAALEHERERVEHDVSERLQVILDIARRSQAKPGPYLSDDDLYDERGLPK